MPANNPRPALPLSATGVPIQMQEHREGSATDFLSPNWCDATTWFSSDDRVENEAAADTGDGLTWSLVNSPVIDVSNGKITQEHRLRPDHGVVVTVDGATLTEKTKPNGLVGDYLVDYDGGTIRFAASQAGKDVRVTYCRSVDSVWTLAPLPGKRLRLTAVEVQFSTDIILTTAVRFEFYGLASVFAPQLMDFINEAQRAFPDIPAIGGGDWRGTQVPTHIFRWPYAEDATRDLLASAGMEVRISLDGNTPLGGARAYATIYATSEDE
jgi:hypothetical protein